ncbi:dehydrogenase [Streptomyces sp. 150FB]|uniref:SDR family NAD(P)-dependent oxidoreductase n=1 Tax=Streptomyces sp. 150FB TaxID=1576605 RepID=UPI00058919EA|nr:SDR family NAD(P)-dependent oxidoreductase [Streptomyces sp. 150FB]KIF78769.1 dehydrogenase [Streptomyces sp. 150FB]
MTSTERSGQRATDRGAALVTGAGTGIGAAITERLAARGRDLVLVARDSVRLEAAAVRLRAEHRVDVLTVPLDLSLPDAPAHLAEHLKSSGVEVDILVNNAGVAVVGPVGDIGPARIRGLVDLNAGAVAETTALFLPAMLARGRGAIVNIASTAAYAPAPYNAAYAASKAFVLSFTQALWHETRGTGVRVVAVSPGAIETPMNPGRARGKRRPEQVAETVMTALRGHAPAVVDGRAYVLQTFVFSRVLPSRTAARLTGNFFRKAAQRTHA